MSQQPEADKWAQAFLKGLQWVRDMPVVLADEYLTKVELALQRGVVFGIHMHYFGGGSASQWACLNIKQYKEYISHSRPGDLYIAWSAAELSEKGLLLAHDQYRVGDFHHPLLLPAQALEKVNNYLEAQYKEIM